MSDQRLHLLVLLVIAVLTCGCEAELGITTEQTADKWTCPPSQSTHRLNCGDDMPLEFVYYNGGYICSAYGGQIKIHGAKCVAYPLHDREGTE